MFSVIYEFKIKAGMEEEFISAWKEMTELIKKFEGGLGSRLHRASDRNYIAYAQWPNKAKWKNSGNKLPKEAELVRRKMRESCEKIETLHELDLVYDLLMHSTKRSN